MEFKFLLTVIGRLVFRIRVIRPRVCLRRLVRWTIPTSRGGLFHTLPKRHVRTPYQARVTPQLYPNTTEQGDSFAQLRARLYVLFLCCAHLRARIYTYPLPLVLLNELIDRVRSSDVETKHHNSAAIKGLVDGITIVVPKSGPIAILGWTYNNSF